MDKQIFKKFFFVVVVVKKKRPLCPEIVSRKVCRLHGRQVGSKGYGAMKTRKESSIAQGSTKPS